MVANFVEIIQDQVLMSKKTLTLTAVAAVIIIGAAFIFAGKSGKEDNGMEIPEMFALKELDTDQWCQAMKDAGMKMVIFTAKHHDGFVMWQSRYTRHGIMSTGFRNGEGDVLSFF